MRLRGRAWRPGGLVPLSGARRRRLIGGRVDVHVSCSRLVVAPAAALAIAGALALGASPAVAAGQPVQVVFGGSGTYTIDQTYVGPGGSCTSHDVGTLTWSAVFHTTIDNGRLQGAVGELAGGIGPGNLAFTITGTCAYKNIVPPCNTQLTFTSSPQPSLRVAGTRVEAQSIPGGLTAAACSPTDAAFILSDLGVLEASLPDSLTAIADMPSSSLAPGSSTSVSSANAPGHVAGSCLGVGRHGTGNISCSASLTWSGTISITCGNKAACKAKRDAAKAAEEARQAAKDYQTIYVVNCGGTNTLQSILLSAGNALTKSKKMCWLSHSAWKVNADRAQHYQEIADDPADPNFGSIAHPHPPQLTGLQSLRRDFPASYRLMQNQLQIAGLVDAVTTSLNRASGAIAAISTGNGAATSDLAKQDQAAGSYAKRAAHLLAGQQQLAAKARLEWRRIASTLHGPHSARVAAVFRRFADGLASKQAAVLDRLEIATLNEIGS